jgi:hypothetical protein
LATAGCNSAIPVSERQNKAWVRICQSDIWDQSFFKLKAKGIKPKANEQLIITGMNFII